MAYRSMPGNERVKPLFSTSMFFTNMFILCVSKRDRWNFILPMDLSINEAIIEVDNVGLQAAHHTYDIDKVDLWHFLDATFQPRFAISSMQLRVIGT